MDKSRFDKKSFKITGAKGIELARPYYLNSDYELSETKPEAITGDTGLLELFRVHPKLRDAALPSFVVRIGHDTHEAVDVDLEGEVAERSAFKYHKNGYWGHRARCLNTMPRSYEVDIWARGFRVFFGTLTLKGFGLRASVTVDAVLIGPHDA